jgi:NAD(P)-dependent dehydrogenase (short-subunit alcohol dehydrogenase family)
VSRAGAVEKPVALVTGANRGLGRGIALALQARGFDVVANDLESPSEPLKGAAFLPGDIADTRQHARMVEEAWNAFGRLDCLVNNAGVMSSVRGDLLELTEVSFDRVLGINLRGTFFLTQRVAKRMLAAPFAEHFRSIVTISSVNAFMAGGTRADYSISKSALTMLVKLYAIRLADAGIRCYEVRPGIMRTDMTSSVREQYERKIADGLVPIKRWGEAEDVGRCVAMLASGELGFSTGEAVHVDGGLHVQTL